MQLLIRLVYHSHAFPRQEVLIHLVRILREQGYWVHSNAVPAPRAVVNDGLAGRGINDFFGTTDPVPDLPKETPYQLYPTTDCRNDTRDREHKSLGQRDGLGDTKPHLDRTPYDHGIVLAGCRGVLPLVQVGNPSDHRDIARGNESPQYPFRLWVEVFAYVVPVWLAEEERGT